MRTLSGMSTNAAPGKGSPRLPRIEILTSAEPGEAAAVTAAVERFLADTAPPSAPPKACNPWQRAALLEGVRARDGLG